MSDNLQNNTIAMSTRNKRKLVYEWLKFLKDEEELTFPIHKMNSKQWFKLFEKHHTGYDGVIFSDVKYFSMQMNSIIDGQMLPYLSKEVTMNPYCCYYIIDTSFVEDESVENSNIFGSPSRVSVTDQGGKFFIYLFQF